MHGELNDHRKIQRQSDSNLSYLRGVWSSVRSWYLVVGMRNNYIILSSSLELAFKGKILDCITQEDLNFIAENFYRNFEMNFLHHV